MIRKLALAAALALPAIAQDDPQLARIAAMPAKELDTFLTGEGADEKAAQARNYPLANSLISGLTTLAPRGKLLVDVAQKPEMLDQPSRFSPADEPMSDVVSLGLRRGRLVEQRPLAHHPAADGLADYSGPLLADLDFAAFSQSALVRIADEVEDGVTEHLGIVIGPLDRRTAVPPLGHRQHAAGDVEQLVVRHHRGVVDHAHRLGVPGAARADLLVRRVRGAASGVPDGRRPDAGQLPEHLLSTPEAAETEDRDLVAGRDVGLVGLDRGVEHEVAVGKVEPPLRATWQGLRRAGDLGLVAAEQHGSSSSRG